MTETNQIIPPATMWDKFKGSIVTGAAVGTVGLLITLLAQSYDWHQWRGQKDLMDLRIEQQLAAAERRLTRVEERLTGDIKDLKDLIRELNAKLDRVIEREKRP